MITKHSQTKYFALRPGVAVPAAGSTLYNLTTDNLNINTGVGGFYKPVEGSGNHNEVQAAGGIGRSIKFIQRRDKSGDKSPLYNRSLEESKWIESHCFNGINIQARAQEQPINNLWLVGAPITTAGEIPLLEEFKYQFQVSAHGDRTDWYSGVYNTPTNFSFYESPDWSLTAYTDPQKLDITVSALVEDYNRKSQSLAFAFAIETAGTSTAGTAVKTILELSGVGGGAVAIGDRVILGYQPTDGSTIGFIMDAHYRETFVQLQANLVTAGFAAATLKPYVLPGTVNAPLAAVVPTAGTTGTSDLFAVLAIDEGEGYYDYRMNTKRRLEVGLVSGFDSVTKTQVTSPSEGSGQYKQLEIAYRNHNMYEETARPKPYMSYNVEFPNELLSDATYDLFYVEHCAHRTATSGMPSFNNMTTVIAVVSFEDPSTPYFTGAANPQKTYIQAQLNDFITSNSLGLPALAI